jgi:hypothetical protein
MNQKLATAPRVNAALGNIEAGTDYFRYLSKIEFVREPFQNLSKRVR